jgi:hypothetical protein
MNIFFTLEAFTDNRGGPSVQAICDATVDATLHPDDPQPIEECVIAEIVRQLVTHLSAVDRFFHACHFADFGNAHLNLPQRRLNNDLSIHGARMWPLSSWRRSVIHRICTIDEYMASRHDNIGAGCMFALLEICLELDLPHDVMQHPAVVSLNTHATDMIFLTNVVDLIYSPILLILIVEYVGHVLLQEGGL